MVRMALSDLPSTDTGVHKHGTTPTSVETEFEHMPGSETQLHNLHLTTTTAKTLSDLPSTETGIRKYRTIFTVVETKF